MKSLLQFLTDSAIISLSLGLVVIAFLVTTALSPINFEESSFAASNEQSVLGESSVGQLYFEPIWENIPNLKITRETPGDSLFVLNIQFEKLQSSRTAKVLRIKNTSSQMKKVVLKATSASAIEDDLHIHLKSKKSENEMKLNSMEEQKLIIQGGEDIEYEVVLEPQENINFNSEIVIEFLSDDI